MGLAVGWTVGYAVGYAVGDAVGEGVGQACVLQVAHFTPPLAAATITERVRCWVPVWQLAEHVDQAQKFDCTQSMGHAWVLHAAVLTTLEQAFPLCSVAVMTERVRVLNPVCCLVLQVLEHTP